MKTIKVRADLFCKVILASMGISNVSNEKLEKDDDVVVYTCDVIEQSNMVMEYVASIFSNANISGSMGKNGWLTDLCITMKYDLEEINGVKYLVVEKQFFESIVEMLVKRLFGICRNAELIVEAVEKINHTSIYDVFVMVEYESKPIFDLDHESIKFINFIGSGIEIAVEDKENLYINIY